MWNTNVLVTWIFGLAVLALGVWMLCRASRPAKARANIHKARCPVCNGLGFDGVAITRITSDGPSAYSAKCKCCGDRIKFSDLGEPIR